MKTINLTISITVTGANEDKGAARIQKAADNGKLDDAVLAVLQGVKLPAGAVLSEAFVVSDAPLELDAAELECKAAAQAVAA